MPTKAPDFTITVSPKVAKAILALGLPGERPQDTVARIVWAVSTGETRERKEGR